MPESTIKVVSAKFKVPWGAWNIETGEWIHNHLLMMSEDEQHQDNVKNGYSCPHKLMPDKCPICLK